jgi:hypothetical protein
MRPGNGTTATGLADEAPTTQHGLPPHVDAGTLSNRCSTLQPELLLRELAFLQQSSDTHVQLWRARMRSRQPQDPTVVKLEFKWDPESTSTLAGSQCTYVGRLRVFGKISEDAYADIRGANVVVVSVSTGTPSSSLVSGVLELAVEYATISLIVTPTSVRDRGSAPVLPSTAISHKLKHA